MKNVSIALFFTFILFHSIGEAQESPEMKGFKSIKQDVIRAQLEFLSSDWMEGRRSGEKGELISSDYIASMLRLYGVKPWGDQVRSPGIAQQTLEKSFFQNFTLRKLTAGGNQTFKLIFENNNSTEVTDYTYGVDFSIRPSSPVELKAPVVFGGYAFKSHKLGLNELEGIDIRGKFILKISGFPTFARQKLTGKELADAERELSEYTEENGALGIIEFNPAMNILGRASQSVPDPSPSERPARPFDVYSSYSIPSGEPEHGILKITVTSAVAGNILRGTKINYQEYILQTDKGEKYSYNPPTGSIIDVKTEVTASTVNVRNVVGMIEGINTSEFIVLGAHYDHMGMNHGYIWNGADDNGSGTVGVMTLARAIIETGKKPEKSIIIALWTAEEEGLLGSEYFVKNFDKSAGKILLNVNFDMISRYISEQEKNKVVMTYTSSQKDFKDLTLTNLKKYGIDLNVDFQPSDDPPGGSDHRSFVAAGIPIMRFKPGHREEYHKPSDETGTIDWDIMEKIIKISFANIWQIADSK